MKHNGRTDAPFRSSRTYPVVSSYTAPCAERIALAATAAKHAPNARFLISLRFFVIVVVLSLKNKNAATARQADGDDST